jgi:hypothetical protein
MNFKQQELISSEPESPQRSRLRQMMMMMMMMMIDGHL